MKTLVLSAGVALGLFAISGSASAHPPGYYGPRPAYYPPGYYAPRPVYYPAPPVVYAPPPPVYYRPAPVYVAPPVAYPAYTTFNFGFSRPGFGLGFSVIR